MIFSHFLSVDNNNSTKKYLLITLFINLDYTPLELWNNSPSGYFGGAKYPSKADIPLNYHTTSLRGQPPRLEPSEKHRGALRTHHRKATKSYTI